MSSTIPPLVCTTPPPIDFDHDDDDVSEGIDSTFSPSEDGESQKIHFRPVDAIKRKFLSYSNFRCFATSHTEAQ